MLALRPARLSLSASVEPRIVAAYGGCIYGPYTGHTFASRHQTDIEHVVAVSEALDSGLCAASASTRRRFASDLLNLTLAAPEVNRCGRSGKCAKDAAEWLPPRNRYWFANRVVEVRRKYRLTIDRREAEALEQILSGCESMEQRCSPMRPILETGSPAPPTRSPAGTTIATDASPARRRDTTTSRRCGAATRPIPSCATATGVVCE